MEPIKILVCGNQAAFVKSHLITAGTVGLPVEFTFDEQWEGLSKTAVFKAGNIVRDQININQQTTVPAEVLAKPKRQLEIGVYGINEDGTVVLPTVWVTAGQIVPGADPFGDEGTEPSLPVWEQAQKGTVKYTPQKLNEEQKVQARQNIGAMKQPAESDLLNFKNSELRNVSTIEFSHQNIDGAQTGGVYVSSDENKRDENGEWFSRLSFEASDAERVVIGGLHDGILDGDAATVWQVKQAAPYLLVAEENENGKGVLVVGDWDTMVLELKSGRSIILAGSGILSSDLDVSLSIYHLAIAYQQDGYAVFSHIKEYNNSIAIVRYDGSVEFKYVELLKLDPTLSLSGDYAAPASVVGKKLGDIETALDSIIAIQESLMGGSV